MQNLYFCIVIFFTVFLGCCFFRDKLTYKSYLEIPKIRLKLFVKINQINLKREKINHSGITGKTGLKVFDNKALTIGLFAKLRFKCYTSQKPQLDDGVL
ncbi:hypothetical protein VF14_33295 [Nostoc linckia z18]|uniref:Lipoprotein n=1 Tax=Nostoc linckia z7 TaxID=1628745 RepID=A0ABX4KRY9_NOSLI|nr:hypothetical protein VF02_06485 [Nostoc linckia z1]PHJ67688.1 hypothetical protein VF05_16805 [Nostoc linckia z3]PHJ79805.1 hypothetical protein VF06_24585 [Nostoc linckia z4]PHJ97209.1 hypothetical protein VF04_13370 [Nostoc linckia z7]PHK03779.1 hypothetical protein VF09_29490 [Nostoc linckia z9]PHK17635.1 hypothetical protein VF11_21165 [Nostoc linckia z14]PHK18291.1 hypothetical protein VF10_23785 [Nostoc linckia z13]PHK28750.1 hypothetical protein VF14_33295 [Nostoc linckia z18]PHK3